VQAAGDLVGPGVELAAGVELRHDHFHRGQLLGGVRFHRDAPAVVFHGDAVIGVDLDLDFVAMPGHGLVDGVVHHLVDQVVQALQAGVADVHGRPLPHRLQALEDLDLFRTVGGYRRVGGQGGFGQVSSPPRQESRLRNLDGSSDQVVHGLGRRQGLAEKLFDTKQEAVALRRLVSSHN
jgi:hypothetical protein